MAAVAESTVGDCRGLSHLRPLALCEDIKHLGPNNHQYDVQVYLRYIVYETIATRLRIICDHTIGTSIEAHAVECMLDPTVWLIEMRKQKVEAAE